jgi:hypothetical protein
MNGLLRDGGETIAYLRRNGKAPRVIWSGGFHSDRQATKAIALGRWLVSLIKEGDHRLSTLDDLQRIEELSASSYRIDTCLR